MSKRSKSKSRSKTKVRHVSKLPKHPKPGELVDMDIEQRDGKKRTQHFEAMDRAMWKMVKNPD